MLRPTLCGLLCLVMGIPLLHAQPDSSGGVLSRFDVEYPGMISWQTYSAGPTTNLDYLQLGNGPRLAWAFTKNLYTEEGIFWQSDHAKVLENLLGVQTQWGHFTPYAEIDNVITFYPDQPTHYWVNYDVGVTFDYFEKFAPTLEIDSFGDKYRRFVSSQLMVFISPRWSILIEYDYFTYAANNSLQLRLNYAF